VANNVNVVNRGFEYICQWMANTAGTGTPYANWTVPTYIGWGTANGYNSAATTLPGSAASTTVGTGQWSDVGPYSESTESRATGVVSLNSSNTVGAGTVTTQVVGTITSLSSQSIGESFLVFTSAKHTARTLFTAVTSGATGFTISSAWPTPAQGLNVPFYVQMNNEVIKVSATATTTTATTIVRGVNGSSAQTAATNDNISFGNPPGSGASNPFNGDLFAHAGFQALALNTGDSIQFTWQVNVTS
jgi:hypothetical protein